VPASRPIAFALPVLFVGLWSTGFIGAKYAMPYAEPFTTLSLRLAAASLVFLIWARVARAPWPNGREQRASLAIGALLHGIYLGGVFLAIDLGLSAGAAALIVGLQPVLTAVAAGPLSGEQVGLRRWLGIAAGFFGVALVTSPKLGHGPDDWPPLAILACLASLVAITLSSAWAKRLGLTVDPRSGGVYQYLGGFALVAILALVLETGRIDWTPTYAFALLWMVFVLSLGAVSLYLHLLSRGTLVSTVSLMYLTPAVAACMAYVLFGEALSPVQIAGFCLAAGGVFLVTRA
jgi:drug/metabolite transporter (DMT)-like permease